MFPLKENLKMLIMSLDAKTCSFNKKMQPKPILGVYNRRLTGIVKVNGEMLI